jgi:hypothetical protein
MRRARALRESILQWIGLEFGRFGRLILGVLDGFDDTWST